MVNSSPERVVLDAARSMVALAEGGTVEIELPTDAGLAAQALAALATWCEVSGNTLLPARDDAPVPRQTAELRRGRVPDPIASMPPERRPGSRLWIYTNFDCNLACDYCCVSSSPTAVKRRMDAATVGELTRQAAQSGAMEVYLTGGEPFLMLDLAEVVRAASDVLPTTILTNGMLFRGRRLQTLRDLPRSVRLQISLDSAEPELHDHHRGAGSWQKSVEGIRTALAEGFTVRVAATVVDHDGSVERRLRDFLDELGIAPDDQVIRPVAQQGVADSGIELRSQTLIPEVTVTADGVYWHPVAAVDDAMLISRELLPLGPSIEVIQQRFRDYRLLADAAAAAFPCA